MHNIFFTDGGCIFHNIIILRTYSILEDLKLILATFKIVFTKESTEGLEEGQTISLNAKEEEKKDV